MEQLGDKVMDGFGLRCSAKTCCLLSTDPPARSNMFDFCSVKVHYKGCGESTPDGDAPPPFGRTMADLPSTPGGTHLTRAPCQVLHAPVPVRLILPPHGSTPHRQGTWHPTCALLRCGFLKELRVAPACPRLSQRPKPDPSFCILLQ